MEESLTTPRSGWPDRLVRTFAVLRGAIAVVFSVALIVSPEQMMPGSSSEPARTLALSFASRTMVVGIAFAVFASRRKRVVLAWILLVDSALQVFDTGMSLATHGPAMSVLPAAFGIIDIWAGLFLLRAERALALSPTV